MQVHLVGVAGTGMGSLAMLFREAGHAVRGSDAAFDPPVGPALRAAGIECLTGYDEAHLTRAPAPELVVVGNVIRRDNPEAVAARARSGTVPSSSMSRALRDHFLVGRRPLVVAGTHGKTTTASLAAWLLEQAGQAPGYFIGGLPKNLPSGAALGATRRKLGASAAPPSPFVVEGDEYDAVYWHKEPKFFDYIGIGGDDVAIVTSVEHDHVDIYPSAAAYEAAFRTFVARVPPGGLLVCDARRGAAARIVSEEARARTAFYALDGDDTGAVTPTWLAAPVAAASSQAVTGGLQLFDLFVGGMSCGRFGLQVPGLHNVRNALAALAACAEGFGVGVAKMRAPLAGFEGVRRRQDLLGEPRGVRVYDDFAHHPTAVNETLRALRQRHPEGALWAVFEPRSATACRALHQEAYAQAFGAADRVIFAPLGRSNLPEGDRLDLARLARDLARPGHGAKQATVAPSLDAVVAEVAAGARSGDTVALLSNGAFGGAHARLLAELAKGSS